MNPFACPVRAGGTKGDKASAFVFFPRTETDKMDGDPSPSVCFQFFRAFSQTSFFSGVIRP